MKLNQNLYFNLYWLTWFDGRLQPRFILSSWEGFLRPLQTQYHTHHFHAWSWSNLKWEDVKKKYDLKPKLYCIIDISLFFTCDQEIWLSPVPYLYLPSHCSRSLQPASRASHSPLPTRGSWWHDRPAYPLSHAGTHLQWSSKLFKMHHKATHLIGLMNSFRVVFIMASESRQPHPSCTAENLHIQRMLPPQVRSCTAQSWSGPVWMGRCMWFYLQRETQKTIISKVETSRAVTKRGRREIDHFKGLYQSVCPSDRMASIHRCTSPYT